MVSASRGRGDPGSRGGRDGRSITARGSTSAGVKCCIRSSDGASGPFLLSTFPVYLGSREAVNQACPSSSHSSQAP